MSEDSTANKATSKRGRRPVTASGNNRRPAGKTRERSRSGRAVVKKPEAAHPYVISDGRPAYVLVPIDEYESMVKRSMADAAIEQVERGDDDFVDADELALELAAERIAAARKAKGWTQTQLGLKLKLPQSQISRIERNPDRTTIRTLKRLARALGVDVSALV